MKKLDNVDQIKKLDPQKVLNSIEAFDLQVSQAWNEMKEVKIPASYSGCNKILVDGMGGSGLGSHAIRSIFYDKLKVPFGLIHGYQLPANLDSKTLYLVSSYSGTTEEPLSTITAAKNKKAKVFGISSGGPLARLISQGKIPGYIFTPQFNPSGQPRMGLGYSLGAQLALFNKLGLIKISDAEIKHALSGLTKLQKKFGPNNPTVKNPAKKLAVALAGKIPLVVTAEFLAGNGHIFANQLNENAKTFSSYFQIPELNHHLLEGLRFPKSNRRNLLFIFFESKSYLKKNQIRFAVTKKVVAKNHVSAFSYALTTKGKLAQSLEMLVFGSYASFYLAALYGINPSKIPWVNFFKAELKRLS